MQDSNPYAPPAAMDPSWPDPRWFRRDGKFVVVRTGAILPGRCIRTNQVLGESDGLIERQLVWTPKWAQCMPAALILMVTLPLFVNSTTGMLTISVIGVLGIVVAGLLSIANQKRVNVRYGLGWRKRRWRLLAQGVIAALCVGGWILCEILKTNTLVTIPLLIGGGTLLGVLYHPLRVARYRDGEFWLKGCSPEFLDSLDNA
jgi:hypothetical protein